MNIRKLYTQLNGKLVFKYSNPTNPDKQPVREVVEHLLKQGHTNNSTIAKVVGVSRERVRKIREELKGPTRKQRKKLNRKQLEVEGALEQSAVDFMGKHGGYLGTKFKEVK